MNKHKPKVKKGKLSEFTKQDVNTIIGVAIGYIIAKEIEPIVKEAEKQIKKIKQTSDSDKQ
jgi:uncharacterized membrane-anchored protein YhcB (DUF1043 family)